VLAFDAPAESAELVKSHFRLFTIGGFAVPFVFAFEFDDAFAGDGMGDDERGLFVNGFGLLHGGDDFLEVVAVNFQNVPAEGFPFGVQAFKGHDIFGEAVDLNIVAVNESDEVVELFLAGKHGGFPIIAFVELAVAH